MLSYFSYSEANHNLSLKTYNDNVNRINDALRIDQCFKVYSVKGGQIMGCNNIFGGNCCTWLVVLLILWLFSNDGGLFGNNSRDYNNGCGCGC